jgi:pimeloyl-ACP methyl ester carboxylesterase
MLGEVLEISGCEVTVERLGKGDPLVVLHGEAGPRGARRFLEQLAKRFEVHVPRHPGWAGASCAAHVTTVRDVALIAQQYIEGLGAPAPVVGLSFGGWLAAEIAANAPTLISKLVLVSPIGVKIAGVNERDFTDVYMLSAADRDALYYSAAGRPVPEEMEGNDVFTEKALAEHAMVRYAWKPFMHDPGLKGRLQRIRAPALLLSGGGDRFVRNPAYYPTYASLIAGARHEVVADAGHRLEEEEPQKTAERIAGFLGALAPAAA